MLNKGQKLFGIKLIAMAEILIFLIALTVYSFYFDDGKRFIDIHPHPFWFILLIVIIQYDTPEIVFCLIMMILFLYVGNLPKYTVWTSDIDYISAICKQPLGWIIVALILDAIKRKRIKNREMLYEEITKLQKINDTLARSFKDSESKRIEIESRLASEKNSFVKTNDSIQILSSMTLENYKTIISSLILSLLNPQKFSFYIMKPEGLELDMQIGWTAEDKYNKFFSSNDLLYRYIVGEKKILSINKAEYEKILFSNGVVAGPVLDIDSGEICGMLKFEEYDFAKLTNKNIEIFKILSNRIGATYIGLLKQERLRKSMFIDDDNKFYSSYYYDCHKSCLTHMAGRMKFSLSSIDIAVTNSDEYSNAEKNELSSLLLKLIQSHCRATDKFFGSKNHDLKYILLLPGATHDSAKVVLDKFKTRLSLIKNPLIEKALFAYEIKEVIRNFVNE